MLTVKEIRGFKLFTGLDENELSDIAGLAERRVYEANSVILSPNAPSEDLFIVESGNDAIQIEIPLGIHDDSIVIHTLTKGETFNFAVLSATRMKTAVAKCLNEVSVIAINGKSLMQLLENNNHMGYIVMRNLADIISTRLSYTTVAFRHELRRLRRVALV